MSQYFVQRESDELQRRVAADEELLKRCLSMLEDHCTANSGAAMLQLVADLRGRLEINSGGIGMTHNLDSSQTAVVSHENKWIPISQQEPPFGAKCLVIDDTQDLAYVEHINRLQGGLIGFRSRYYPRMKNE